MGHRGVQYGFQMNAWSRVLVGALCAACSTGLLSAQMPFYTDNTDVTDEGTLHFELFNELDALQSAQYPDQRQNTLNYKLNYGLPHGLELDIDSPYLSIMRTDGLEERLWTGRHGNRCEVEFPANRRNR